MAPELAAAVVKEYLLPLFEADDLKHIHHKAKQTLTSLAQPAESTTTVYEELKLSAELSNELGSEGCRWP